MPQGEERAGTKMGNRVEDGNRAKNWVVQTSSIRGPVFIFAQRMPLSLRLSLWFLAVSSRCFFFSHPLSSTSFLSAQPWENHIFPFSVSVVSFYPGRKMAFDVFLFFAFFFLFFCGKRVLFICWKETGFLVGWSRVLLDRLDESFVVYSTSFRCFSLLLVPTKRAKNSSTFTFHPFSFISITPITVTRCMKERMFWIKWNASNRILRVNRISSLRYNSSSDNFFEKHPIL